MNTNIFILGSEGGLEPPSLIFIIQRHATIAPLAATYISRKNVFPSCFGTLRTLRLAFRVPFMSREEWGGVPHRRLYYYNNVR